MNHVRTLLETLRENNQSGVGRGGDIARGYRSLPAVDTGDGIRDLPWCLCEK